ncbi:hypothetical protein SASPL_154670 [Salvia splendens]|uniref:Potassium channel n=1 Tax=Salvia splendens TaxID=180675 RepID=A0A8X8W0R7_SALSN|nr:hypothetical protein SASPL_154670 [Salvia splendens]
MEGSVESKLEFSRNNITNFDNSWWYNAWEKLVLIGVAIYCTYKTACIIFYYLSTSMYFSILTMAAISLIFKRSKTFRYQDMMAHLTKYMTGGRNLLDQIKGRSRLQTDAVVLQVRILKLSGVHEDFFLPGKVIKAEGNVVDQLYCLDMRLINRCHILQEEVGTGADGLEEIVSLLEPNSSFGDIPILCNIPPPYTVRVGEHCRLLRVNRQTFSNILEICFHDRRKVMTNLLEGKESNLRLKQLKLDILVHIDKQETALASRVNSTAFCSDMYQLKSIIRSGADPNKKD